MNKQNTHTKKQKKKANNKLIDTDKKMVVLRGEKKGKGRTKSVNGV